MAIASIMICLLHHTSTNLQMLLIIWPYDLILSRRTHQQPNYISRHQQLLVIMISWTLLVTWTPLLVNRHLLPRSILIHHLPLLFRLSTSHPIHFSLFNTFPRARYNDAGTLCKSIYHLPRVSIFPPVILVFLLRFLAKKPSDKNKSDDASRWWPDWYR